MMFGNNPGSDHTWLRMKSKTVGAELGVWKGDSSAKFLNVASHVHLVDPWSVQPYLENKEVDKERYFSRYEELVGSANPQDFQTYYDDIYESVVKRFKNKPVTIHRMTTTEWFKNFKEKLDWIYVDARHDTPGVYEDLINSVKVLKKGGVIYGDDYGFNKYCVKVAVDKFIEKTGLTLNNFYQDQYEIIT